MPPQTETVDLTTIAISLGRVETKIDHLSGLEERLRTVEESVTRIEASARPKTPWYLVASGLSGAGAFVVVILGWLAKLV